MIKAKLKNICNILNGYAFKSNNYVDDGIRIIRITNVQKGIIEDSDPKFYPNEEEKKIQKYLLNENDLLISLTGNVGRVGLLRKDLLPAALNQRVGCIRIKDKNKLNIRYLFQLLNSNTFENICISNSKGIAQKNLSTEWLKEYEFIIPNMEEQLIIAEKLENIQKIITIKQSQLCKLDELIKSLFVEMFGDPILNNKKLPIKKLKDLTITILSGTTPKGGEKVYIDSGIEFYRSQNIWKNKIKKDDIAYIDQKTHENMKKSSLKYNDLLITKTGRINTQNSSLGRTAIYTGGNYKANVNGHVYLVRLKENENPEFILRILISNQYLEYIRSVCVGGIDKRQLNKNHIENFPIIYPSKEKQKIFTNKVNQIDKQKFEIQNSLNKMKELYETMMNKYFG